MKGSAWCPPERGLSVDVTHRRTNLKLRKVLVKFHSNKSE